MTLFRPEVIENRRTRLYGEVVLRQPMTSWVFVALLLSIAVAAVAIASLTTFARIEQAPGTIRPNQAVSKVFAPRAGVVIAMKVTEGSEVKAGQPLALISIEQRGEDNRAHSNEGLAAVEVQKRLNLGQVELERDQLGARRRNLVASIRAISDQERELAAQAELQQSTIESVKRTFDQLDQLIERGFVSRLDYERRRQSYLSELRQLRALNQQAAALRAERIGLQGELAQLPLASAAKVAELQSSGQKLVEEEARIRDENSYVITAPTSGRVVALQIFDGKFVDGGKPLLAIVPKGSKFEAEVFVPGRAMGLLKEGQEVQVLLDAFPYQEYGSLPGRVDQISRTLLAPNELDTTLDLDEPAYRVRVQLDAQYLMAGGQRLPLQPGMTLKANLVLERRSLLRWLSGPLRAIGGRS